MIHDAQIERAVEAMREDPFMDDAHLLGTTQQDERMRHYARIAIAASAPPEVDDHHIIDLYQQGHTLDAIAEAVGLTKSAVHARLKKRGLTATRKRVKWTRNMRNELIGLRAIKAPMTTIAKRLKVSRSAIYAELKRIGDT